MVGACIKVKQALRSEHAAVKVLVVNASLRFPSSLPIHVVLTPYIESVRPRKSLREAQTQSVVRMGNLKKRRPVQTRVLCSFGPRRQPGGPEEVKGEDWLYRPESRLFAALEACRPDPSSFQSDRWTHPSTFATRCLALTAAERLGYTTSS